MKRLRWLLFVLMVLFLPVLSTSAAPGARLQPGRNLPAETEKQLAPLLDVYSDDSDACWA